MNADTPQPIPLETYDLKNGLVSSDLGQASVDAFAADFQALRHFGEKIGSALDLNNPWMGALQESAYSVAYSTPEKALDTLPLGKGARVGQRALLFEMLTLITEQEPEA
jgi:hypothetical protein